MGSTVGGASRRQSIAQDGTEPKPVSHTFDLSTLDGWSSALNCFPLHVAGVVKCTSVQMQASVASLGSRKYRTVLSSEQLDDPNAVVRFAGEMQETSMLKVAFVEASLGTELASGNSSTTSAVVNRKLTTESMTDDLFNYIYEEMKGLYPRCGFLLHPLVHSCLGWGSTLKG